LSYRLGARNLSTKDRKNITCHDASKWEPILQCHEEVKSNWLKNGTVDQKTTSFNQKYYWALPIYCTIIFLKQYLAPAFPSAHALIGDWYNQLWNLFYFRVSADLF
jgi:hypothetical protein